MLRLTVDDLKKAGGKRGLVKKRVTVSRGGRTFQQTVWVSPWKDKEKPKEEEAKPKSLLFDDEVQTIKDMVEDDFNPELIANKIDRERDQMGEKPVPRRSIMEAIKKVVADIKKDRPWHGEGRRWSSILAEVWKKKEPKEAPKEAPKVEPKKELAKETIEDPSEQESLESATEKVERAQYRVAGLFSRIQQLQTMLGIFQQRAESAKRVPKVPKEDKPVPSKSRKEGAPRAGVRKARTLMDDIKAEMNTIEAELKSLGLQDLAKNFPELSKRVNATATAIEAIKTSLREAEDSLKGLEKPSKEEVIKEVVTPEKTASQAVDEAKAEPAVGAKALAEAHRKRAAERAKTLAAIRAKKEAPKVAPKEAPKAEVKPVLKLRTEKPKLEKPVYRKEQITAATRRAEAAMPIDTPDRLLAQMKGASLEERLDSLYSAYDNNELATQTKEALDGLRMALGVSDQTVRSSIEVLSSEKLSNLLFNTMHISAKSEEPKGVFDSPSKAYAREFLKQFGDDESKIKEKHPTIEQLRSAFSKRMEAPKVEPKKEEPKAVEKVAEHRKELAKELPKAQDFGVGTTKEDIEDDKAWMRTYEADKKADRPISLRETAMYAALKKEHKNSKIDWDTSKVQIEVKSGKQSVAASVAGSWAVHKTPDSSLWSISHVGTGLAAAGNMKSEKAAKEYLEKLVATEPGLYSAEDRDFAAKVYIRAKNSPGNEVDKYVGKEKGVESTLRHFGKENFSEAASSHGRYYNAIAGIAMNLGDAVKEHNLDKNVANAAKSFRSAFSAMGVSKDAVMQKYNSNEKVAALLERVVSSKGKAYTKALTDEFLELSKNAPKVETKAEPTKEEPSRYEKERLREAAMTRARVSATEAARTAAVTEAAKKEEPPKTAAERAAAYRKNLAEMMKKVKAAEPKAEPKKEEPKAEPKKEEPKAAEKPTEKAAERRKSAAEVIRDKSAKQAGVTFAGNSKIGSKKALNVKDGDTTIGKVSEGVVAHKESKTSGYIYERHDGTKSDRAYPDRVSALKAMKQEVSDNKEVLKDLLDKKQMGEKLAPHELLMHKTLTSTSKGGKSTLDLLEAEGYKPKK